VLTPVGAEGNERTNLVRYGRLMDVSGGGLGVMLKETHEGILAGYQTVRVQFRPPHTSALVERECLVRSRALLDDGIRLGLQFVMVEDVALAFEPQWDCQACGAKGLLEKTHPHCCGCGTVRAVDAGLADWGDLIPRGDHRFTGDDQSCPGCGASWSDEAQHCGLCGTALR
jgi:hypothetical protein